MHHNTTLETTHKCIEKLFLLCETCIIEFCHVLICFLNGFIIFLSEINIRWLCCIVRYYNLGLMLLVQTMEEKPRRRPLVRAASEESSSDLSSISCSPSPGDTLPWNLPKHHRIKRSKSASGDVLDPAERAVIRIAGMFSEKRAGTRFAAFLISKLCR